MTDKRILLLFTVLLIPFIIVCGIAANYLPGHIQGGGVITVACVGLLLIFLTCLVFTKFEKGKIWAKKLSLFVLILFTLQFVSMFMPGKVSYAKFGFTLYGLIPIPAFDITVKSSGQLGFRIKSHKITRAEIQNILTPDVETVVIAIGWHSIAKVDKDVFDIKDIKIEVLDTEKAYQRFNQLKSQGIKVAMLAHSTC